MSVLFEAALNNTHLKYIDAFDGGKKITLQQIKQKKTTSLNDSDKSLAFLYVDNSIESISVFWFLMQSKHCLALLSNNLSAKFKNALEDKYNPKFIYDNQRSQIPHYHKSNIGSIELMISDDPEDYLIDENIKVLLSTSGTTGSPKFVKLSEENLLENTNSICNYLPIIKQDVTPLNLPISYSYGLSVLLTNSVAGGEVICSVPDILQREFWNAFEQFEFTSLAGVPFIYEMLDRFSFTKKSYHSLRYMTQAGGKLKNELVEKFGSYALENNLKFYAMYGATEASARMSYLEPGKIIDKKGSIGKPIKKGKFEIDQETSELIYEGPNVFGGYANDFLDLSTYDKSTVLRTGDIARKDAEGYYYIVGRIKRFVKISGLRINLDEVEELIFSLKKIHVKCIGLNDKQLIVFYKENNLDIKNLKKEVARELKIHSSFVRFKEVSDFPLTPNEKIDYKKLEANL
jgi:acyl-CoA synthetase (AMP-forming)/AMP-acid ligase II